MIGIYKITNNVNHKTYIGQSVEVEERIKEHKRIPFRENRPTYNYPLYKEMREYGLENFSFEPLKECKKEDLNRLELYYVELYNSFLNGYNQTPGGDAVAKGNLSNHHILTEDDVFNIRTRYANHESRWSVFQDYKSLVSTDTFAHVWTGKTWNWVLPEVFTIENIEWHKKHLGELSLVQKNVKMTEADVKEIRRLRRANESRKSIYEQYKDRISFSAFNAIWYNQSWKGVE